VRVGAFIDARRVRIFIHSAPLPDIDSTILNMAPPRPSRRQNIAAFRFNDAVFHCAAFLVESKPGKGGVSVQSFRWVNFAQAACLGLFFIAAADVRAVMLRTWPGGAAPCDTTLQACINGSANDDIVQLVTDGPIDEDLLVTKPLSLVAASGHRPVLSAGNGITALYGPGAGIGWSMTFDGIAFAEGGIGVRSYSGDANVTLRNLDVTAVAQAYVGPAVGIDNFGSGHLTYAIERNRIRLNDSIGLQAIGVTSGAGGTFEGSIHDNRIEGNSSSPDNADTGILIIGTQAPAPNMQVYSNQLVGNLVYGLNLWVAGQSKLRLASNVLRSTTTNSFGVTLTLTSGAGITLDAQVFNNTIAGFGQGVLGNGAGISGRLSGNIFAYNATLAIHQQNSTLSEDHTLFFANGGPAPTLGTGSMIADPKFRRGIDDMRLTTGSPAIDAADSAALATLLAAAAQPAIDADGLRRFKGAGNLADIGAFEFGDGALIETATAANGGVIASALLDGNAAALPQLIEDRTPDTYAARGFDADSTALTYATGHFGVVDESDGSAPVANSAYNVFVPAAGDGVFEHVSHSASNVFGFTTELSNAYIDGHPERILLATHRAGPLFDHPFGFAYLSNHWFFQQLDAVSDFPDGLSFHVYAQDPSLNAFTWNASAAASSTAINHVLLNGEPCGRVYVTGDNLNPHPIAVRYAAPHWFIFNLDDVAIPQGASFNVVVDEAAIAFCRHDHIFHDGVDGS